MNAFILCGGLGTRLRPVIGEHQKCAVTVGGRPWITRVVDFLVEGGIDGIYFLAGYRWEEIEDALCAHLRATDVGVLICNDGVQAAIRSIGSSPALVVNGDTLVPGFDLRKFLLVALESGGNWAVRGPNWDASAVAESGIYFYEDPQKPLEHSYMTNLPFFDIGTPHGLALARETFTS